MIDATNRRVVAQVPSGIDLTGMSVSSIKLGPEGQTTYSPAISSLRNFEDPVELNVSYRDVNEVWTLFVEEVEAAVSISKPDVWTGVAWLRASGIEGRDNGFRIRKAGGSEWNEVGGVSSDGGSFSAAA